MSLNVHRGAAASLWFALGVVTGIAGTRLLVGARPESGETVPAASVAQPAANPHVGANGASSRSVEFAAQTLSLRLASEGGSDADWELLAQSYDVLGREADAQRARRHEPNLDRSLQDAVLASAAMIAGPAATVGAAPVAAAAPGSDRATSLLASADEHRRKRDFAAACSEYEKVAAMKSMTVDAWADYADALGSRDGTLVGQAATALENALALAPKHTKALWLKASLEHEQGHYAAAVATWKQLLALLPPESGDARIVRTNAEEASRLAKAAAATGHDGAGA